VIRRLTTKTSEPGMRAGAKNARPYSPRWRIFLPVASYAQRLTVLRDRGYYAM